MEERGGVGRPHVAVEGGHCPKQMGLPNVNLLGIGKETGLGKNWGSLWNHEQLSLDIRLEDMGKDPCKKAADSGSKRKNVNRG